MSMSSKSPSSGRLVSSTVGLRFSRSGPPPGTRHLMLQCRRHKVVGVGDRSRSCAVRDFHAQPANSVVGVARQGPAYFSGSLAMTAS
jgi:hypothetical protein